VNDETNKYDDKWEMIAAVFSDYEWHKAPELVAALQAAAGMEYVEANSIIGKVVGARLNIETWGGKRMRTSYRLTPPGELHIPWRWNSGEAQEREAMRAATRR
jgi:hypothetical protein